MERRHAAIRKTCDESAILDGHDDANSTLVMGKNTKKFMHAKNGLYQELCIYCDRKFSGSLVQHYVNNHPDCEVPISRLSPQMAERLKKEGEIHRNRKKIITGLCYFCEEKPSYMKFGWQRHLLSHTGEKLYSCTDCQLKTKNEHGNKTCNGNVSNIFESKEDDSLAGFMCKDCNYFQFSRDRLIGHMKNEHGFENPSEPHNYMELAVVKSQST